MSLLSVSTTSKSNNYKYTSVTSYGVGLESPSDHRGPCPKLVKETLELACLKFDKNAV